MAVSQVATLRLPHALLFPAEGLMPPFTDIARAAAFSHTLLARHGRSPRSRHAAEAGLLERRSPRQLRGLLDTANRARSGQLFLLEPAAATHGRAAVRVVQHGARAARDHGDHGARTCPTTPASSRIRGARRRCEARGRWLWPRRHARAHRAHAGRRAQGEGGTWILASRCSRTTRARTRQRTQRHCRAGGGFARAELSRHPQAAARAGRRWSAAAAWSWAPSA